MINIESTNKKRISKLNLGKINKPSILKMTILTHNKKESYLYSKTEHDTTLLGRSVVKSNYRS